MQNRLDVRYRRGGRAERRLGERLFLPSQGIQYPFQTTAACVITIFRNTQRGKYDRSLRGCKAEGNTRKPHGIRSSVFLVHVPQSVSKVGWHLKAFVIKKGGAGAGGDPVTNLI